MMIFLGATSPFSGDPIPFIPFPWKGKGKYRKRGSAPLRHPLIGKGGYKGFACLLYTVVEIGELKRGEASLI